MKVLIVHYHLKSGGVTTVIRRQIEALASRKIESAVLVGEPPAGAFGVPVSVEPALAYDDPDSDREAEMERVRSIVRAVGRASDVLGEDVVVHVHNPTIRKNSSLLHALSELSAAGRRLFLQVHDLAEDWRPDVYTFAPYPDGARWAAINRFDVEALERSGAGPVAFLPNSVGDEGPKLGGAAKRRSGPGLVLYPVRGLRRKNLGEAILLSLFARKGSRVGVTLPPSNPKNLPIFDSWREAAAELEAPIAFNIGLERSLDDAYAEARAVLTTSVKEGFGLSYLEPASRARLTLGRRLPRVVSDFESAGLSFPGLYDGIVVPRSLFDEGGYSRRVFAVVSRAASAFGRPDSGTEFGRRVAASVLSGYAAGPDFGRLDETAQLEVLRAIASDRRLRSAFIAANPFLEDWDAVADKMDSPAPKKLAPWSQAVYADRLPAAYRDALEGEGYPAPDKNKLLDSYLLPDYFYGVGI